MSWNRLSSDTCSYRNELAQSVGSLGWVLDPSRFENNSNVVLLTELLEVMMLVLLKVIWLI